MRPEWKDWIAQLKADGKYMAVPAITRGKGYAFIFTVTGDVSADAFAGAIRASPDAAGSALATFTVSVGSYAGGVTPVTFSLASGTTAALPADSAAKGVIYLPFDILHTPSGLGTYRCAGGLIPISGAIA